MKRAFPALYAKNVEQTAQFYIDLGFSEVVRMPGENGPGYIGLKRDESELAITTAESPRQLIGVEPGDQPRFEMFIYVDDLDKEVERIKGDQGTVYKDPQEMPWGERIAYVSDPEGNPVALAQGIQQ
jgi:lactoylglutathione lyase